MDPNVEPGMRSAGHHCCVSGWYSSQVLRLDQFPLRRLLNLWFGSCAESVTHSCPGAPWLTVKDFPAIVKVPVRALVLVLAATENLTVPLPEPLLPEVMVIQLAWLTAVQLQELVVATFTVPVPPLAMNDWEVGVIVYSQSGAPAWFNMKDFPATVKVPVRRLVLVLAATEYLTVPLPEPLLPEVMVIQFALLTAVQQQPDSVVTFMLPLPPLAPKD